jgi:hypothetical protein
MSGAGDVSWEAGCDSFISVSVRERFRASFTMSVDCTDRPTQPSFSLFIMEPARPWWWWRGGGGGGG